MRFLIRKPRVALYAVWLMVSSCATLPTGPLAPGELRLLQIHVPERIDPGLPYVVSIAIEADGIPQVFRACFFWTGLGEGLYREGPFCFPHKDVKLDPPAAVRVILVTRNPRMYKLEGYIEYFRDGKIEKTNEVSAQIFVGSQ